MSIDTAEPQYKYLHSDSGQTRPLFPDRPGTPSLDLHKIGDPAIDLPKPGVSSEQGCQLDSHRPDGTIIVGIANTGSNALLALDSPGDTEPIHISACPSGYFTWYGQVRDTNARIANALLQSSRIATSSAPSQAICIQSLDSCMDAVEDEDTIEFKWTRRRHRIRQLARRYSESTNADH